MNKLCPRCKKEYPPVIIMDSNILSITAYFTWYEDYKKAVCWECFCNQDKQEGRK
jgi:hypothetical protein